MGAHIIGSRRVNKVIARIGVYFILLFVWLNAFPPKLCTMILRPENCELSRSNSMSCVRDGDEEVIVALEVDNHPFILSCHEISDILGISKILSSEAGETLFRS